MATIAQWISRADIATHLPFLLIALSYGLTLMDWLRAWAILALLAFIAVDLATGRGAVDTLWYGVLIAINAVQLGLLIRERLSWRPTASERQLLADALAPLDDAQVSRIYRAGEFRDLKPGEQVTVEDEPVDELYFLCTGHAAVEVKGRPVAQLGPRCFIGEVAYLTGSLATATVTASEACRVLAFDRRRFDQVCASDPTVAALIHGLLGRDLARKMRSSNVRLAANEA